MRKDHLQHTVKFGPTCKGGRFGGSLNAEHTTVPAAKFLALSPELQCERCVNSKLFSFLVKQQQKKVAA